MTKACQAALPSRWLSSPSISVRVVCHTTHKAGATALVCWVSCNVGTCKLVVGCFRLQEPRGVTQAHTMHLHALTLDPSHLA